MVRLERIDRGTRPASHRSIDRACVIATSAQFGLYRSNHRSADRPLRIHNSRGRIINDPCAAIPPIPMVVPCIHPAPIPIAVNFHGWARIPIAGTVTIRVRVAVIPVIITIPPIGSRVRCRCFPCLTWRHRLILFLGCGRSQLREQKSESDR